MHYDAIIFDLDGTVMPNGRNSMPTGAMCQAVQANNDWLVLCAATGRGWPEAQPVLDALGVNRPSIIAGGTIIIHPQTEEILWQEGIDEPTVLAIAKVAKAFSYKVTFSSGREISEEVYVDELRLKTVNIFYILDVLESSEDYRQIMNALSLISGVTVSQASSWNVAGAFDIHITPSQATKEHAVVELCDMLGLNRARVAGVGDGQNDTHLFNAVGHKVAMGNAVAELKEAADIVIGDVAEDGLAQFIEEVAKKS
jgi:HAD superfamily hydrolase (TIGR01484 family)